MGMFWYIEEPRTDPAWAPLPSQALRMVTLPVVGGRLVPR